METDQRLRSIGGNIACKVFERQLWYYNKNEMIIRSTPCRGMGGEGSGFIFGGFFQVEHRVVGSTQ
jgi:hypothetical protein